MKDVGYATDEICYKLIIKKMFCRVLHLKTKDATFYIRIEIECIELVPITAQKMLLN